MSEDKVVTRFILEVVCDNIKDKSEIEGLVEKAREIGDVRLFVELTVLKETKQSFK